MLAQDPLECFAPYWYLEGGPWQERTEASGLRRCIGGEVSADSFKNRVSKFAVISLNLLVRPNFHCL
jgi:hypothetical protein